MAVYLIDYENVRSEGLRGVVTLQEEDRVYLFYSGNADSLTFEAHDWIMNSKAKIQRYKMVRGGKNALDFQLSSFLGYLIREDENGSFYIISKDKGFYYVMDFWTYLCKDHHANLVCGPTIEEAMKRKTYAEFRRQTEFSDEVMENGVYDTMTEQDDEQGMVHQEIVVLEMAESHTLVKEYVSEQQEEAESVVLTEDESAAVASEEQASASEEVSASENAVASEEVSAEIPVENRRRRPRSRSKKKETAAETVAEAVSEAAEPVKAEEKSETTSKRRRRTKAVVEEKTEPEQEAQETEKASKSRNDRKSAKNVKNTKNPRRRKSSGKDEAAATVASPETVE